MRVNVAVEGKANVHQVLDALQAVALDVVINAQRMRHGIIDHAAIGVGKAEIVLEKVDMPKDMRGHQQIGDLRVGVEQKGQSGVAVEHNLVDFRQPHGAVEV